MIEYIPKEKRSPPKLIREEQERRRIIEYSCYNEELDLWDSTRLDKINREDECRRMMEKLKI